MANFEELIAQAKAAGVPLNVTIETPPMQPSELLSLYKRSLLDWKRREYELLMRIDRLERQLRGEPQRLPPEVEWGHGPWAMND